MYNTGNPVPSAALEDMADNAQTFDALVTQTEGTTTDRLGRTRRVFQQILMDMGFQPLSGSFQTGATLTQRNQVLQDKTTGVFYSWNGTLPKVVSAGSTPATAGGIGALLWVDRTDLMLRNDLADTNGAHLVGNSAFYIEDILSANVTNIPDKAMVLARTRAGYPGGGGVFEYWASSLATSDNLSVFTPSVGSGRLIRKGYTIFGFNGDIDPQWGGAVPDGSTDCLAAFNLAYAAGSSVKIPAGTFYLSDTPTIAAGASISIRGAGIGVSVVNCLKGLLSKSFANSNNEYFSLSDLSILSLGAGTDIAVRLYRSSSMAAFEDQIKIDNVFMSCSGGLHANTNCFRVGIQTEYLRFVSVTNCRLYGKEGQVITSDLSGASGNAQAAVRIIASDTVSQFGFIFLNNWMSSWATLIESSGWTEGFYITGGEYWYCYFGVNIAHTTISGSSPLSGTVRISNAHINASKTPVRIVNVSTVGISNSELYIGVGGGLAAGGTVLSLSGCVDCQITGNKLSNAYNVSTHGILAQNCSGVVITGNTIKDTNNNAVISVGTTDLFVADNDISGPIFAIGTGIYADGSSTGTIGANRFGTGVTTRVTNGTCDYSPARIQKTGIVTMASGLATVTITPSHTLSFKPNSATIFCSYTAGHQITGYYDYDSSTVSNLVFVLKSDSGTDSGTFRYLVEYPDV